ncbi:hypothetical protein PAXRUDRAFT_18483 [Paxillus rubicundulus Ve08.2h10]|uniref:Uncharacterized protein n=1 Tax=Paxillus rubicundulus Ve08.2h10 TaxID=930991 RepID=A0A0D0DEQ0_9AGAM|nr:hypothetical protein PAXRUDRAFT_18483 [Paxillus rubicundulus Ve08.2h10]
MAKMKVKPMKLSKGVTRATWEAKQTTRGPVARLTPVRQETPTRKISCSISSSTVHPQGPGSSTPLCSLPDDDSAFEFDHTDTEPIPRLRLPIKTQNDYLRQ